MSKLHHGALFPSHSGLLHEIVNETISWTIRVTISESVRETVHEIANLVESHLRLCSAVAPGGDCIWTLTFSAISVWRDRPLSVISWT